MKLLFDATELSYYQDESGHRAGVFFVALNLFRELRKKCDIVFVCNFKRYYFMKELMSKSTEFDGIGLVEECSIINKFWGWLNYVVRNANNKVKYGVLSLSRYYENLLYRENKHNKEILKDYGIYFSPFSAPSKEIENADLLRLRMLHDIIPLLEAGGIPKNPRLWCWSIYNSINDKDFYITNSENTRDDILKYFPQVNPENIKTTYLGVNDNFKPVDKIAEFKYVFSLCTLGKRKNLIFAIKNFFEFINRYKIDDLYLVLGGGIWKKFENELFQAIGNFDKSKIIFKGYVKDEELPELYSNALMFIYPSLYEGFGLPVLEAMKCGCPVITSNRSSLPEVIGDAGIQINPEDDEELIEAYKKMYFDTFYRELCRERGIIRAKKFSWETCANEILDFIEEKSKYSMHTI